MLDQPTTGLAQRIDAIESAYEFMLAYAAQGRRGTEGGPSHEIRERLQRLVDALEDLTAVARRAARTSPPAAARAMEDFLQIAEADATRARIAALLVLSQDAISSQLIDNLNASIHLRALLTDLFLLDSVVTATVQV